MQDDINSLSHSRWRCKYHIVFAPKYRRRAIYGDIRKDIGIVLRKLCEIKGVEIIEAELCPDHVHMLVSIPPNLSVSQFVGYLKGKSSLMIFDRHANLKYKYGNRHFWCRGYYVDTVGKNEKKIAEYIQKQLQDDIAEDQISMKEFVDPFGTIRARNNVMYFQHNLSRALYLSYNDEEQMDRRGPFWINHIRPVNCLPSSHCSVRF